MRAWGSRAGAVGAVVGIFVVLSGAPAAGAEAPPLTLADAIADARARNPELAAARERVQALRALPRQAAAWDDPMLAWDSWNFPDSFRVDRADNNIFRLSQKIPFPGKRRLAGEVATHDAARGAREADAVELAVIAEVKTTYYALWEAQARLDLLQRDRDLVARLTRAVERKYATSEATQVDALRLQIELTHLTNELETQRLTIERARADLAAVLSRPSSEVRGTPVPPAPPHLEAALGELVATALERRPEVLGETEAIARDTTAVELARKSRLPDFEVALSRFVNYGMPDGIGATASVTLPIFNRGKYDAAVDEANARLAATRAQQRRVADVVRREVEQAYLAARTAFLQYDLFARHPRPARRAGAAGDGRRLRDRRRALRRPHRDAPRRAGGAPRAPRGASHLREGLRRARASGRHGAPARRRADARSGAWSAP